MQFYRILVVVFVLIVVVECYFVVCVWVVCEITYREWLINIDPDFQDSLPPPFAHSTFLVGRTETSLLRRYSRRSTWTTLWLIGVHVPDGHTSLAPGWALIFYIYSFIIQFILLLGRLGDFSQIVNLDSNF